MAGWICSGNLLSFLAAQDRAHLASRLLLSPQGRRVARVRERSADGGPAFVPFQEDPACRFFCPAVIIMERDSPPGKKGGIPTYIYDDSGSDTDPLQSGKAPLLR